MAEVMIQEKEDAAAWLSTLHGEELMQEAAVPKKIVAEDFFLWRNCGVIQSVEWMDIKAKRLAASEGSANENSDFSLETPSGNFYCELLPWKFMIEDISGYIDDLWLP